MSNFWHRSWVSREVLQVGLFFSLLLIFEHILPVDVQYASRSYFAFYGQLFIFVGLGLGQVVAFVVERFLGRRLDLDFAHLGLWVLAWTLLQRVFPGQAWIFAICAFSGFGFYLGVLYRLASVRQIVITAGVVGVLAAALFPLVSQIDTRWLKATAFPAFFLTVTVGLFWRRKLIRAAGMLIVMVATAAPFLTDWSRLRPRVFDVREGEFEFVGKPRFSPLLRTEIVRDVKTDSYFILTNGSRMAPIPTRPTRNRHFTDPIDELGDLAKNARALIIGSAGGRNVRLLLTTQIGHIVANDINPQVFSVVREDFGEQTGNVYDDPRVTTVAMDARRLMQIDKNFYDFIFIETLATGARAGAFSGMVEASMYTLEAFEDMYNRLRPGGRIYFSEYRHLFAANEIDESFVHKMSRDLQCVAKFKEAGIRTESTIQSRETPKFKQRELGAPRDILIVEKPRNASDVLSQPPREGLVCRDKITDDKPFFLNLRYEFEYMRKVLIAGTAIFFLILALIWKLSSLPPTHALAVMSSGAAYTLGISAFSGMVAFHLGSPFYITPFILALSFSIGFFTYAFFPFVVRSNLVSRLLLGVCLTTSAGLVFHWWTGIDTLAIRTTVLVLLAIAPIFLLELPFLYFLRISDKRADIVAYENLGAIAGVLAASGLRGVVGYSNMFLWSLAIALLCSIYAIALARCRVENSM